MWVFFLKKVKPKRKLEQRASSFSICTPLVEQYWSKHERRGCPYPPNNRKAAHKHTLPVADSQMQPSGLTSKPCALGKAGYYSTWMQTFLTPVCFVLLLSTWSLSPLRNTPSASSAWLRLRLCTHSPNLQRGGMRFSKALSVDLPLLQISLIILG